MIESYPMKSQFIRTGLASYLRSHEHAGGIIVCERLKFIYMKPAKTAGTSLLRETLEKSVTDIFHFKDHPNIFNHWINNITDRELETYFIFSVVRNPWERMVSLATYFDVPFAEFVRNFDAYLEDKNIGVHSLPLSRYTHIGDIQFVDLIARFENLQQDINLVFDRIGIGRQKLPHVNKSDHKHFSYYYTQTEIEKVAEIYKKDIKFYGYSFHANPDDQKT
jgi:hypothetical protein